MLETIKDLLYLIISEKKKRPKKLPVKIKIKKLKNESKYYKRYDVINTKTSASIKKKFKTNR